SKPLAILAIGYAVPLGWYATTMARLQRTGAPLDPHVSEGHWAGMAALGIAIIALMLLASIRTHGWRLPAWSAGLALAVVGAASIMFDTYAGSFGSVWGAAALTGGVLFILAAEKQHNVDTG